MVRLDIKRYKPIYEFTAEEQAVLDELYRTYPHCDAALQKRAHCLQVRAVQWYETAFQRAASKRRNNDSPNNR